MRVDEKITSNTPGWPRTGTVTTESTFPSKTLVTFDKKSLPPFVPNLHNYMSKNLCTQVTSFVITETKFSIVVIPLDGPSPQSSATVWM